MCVCDTFVLVCVHARTHTQTRTQPERERQRDRETDRHTHTRTHTSGRAWIQQGLRHRELAEADETGSKLKKN